jgi:hypothetical protein
MLKGLGLANQRERKRVENNEAAQHPKIYPGIYFMMDWLGLAQVFSVVSLIMKLLNKKIIVQYG